VIIHLYQINDGLFLKTTGRQGRTSFRSGKNACRMRRQDLADAQFADLKRDDLLHAGRSGYRHGRTALNLGLQTVPNKPSDCAAPKHARAR
jgi:hypothetical protein